MVSAQHRQGLLSFANEAHVLLLNEASVEDLCARVAEASNEHIGGEKGLESEMSGLVGNFRANLVVSGATAYEEDGWEALQIGPSVRAEVSCLCLSLSRPSRVWILWAICTGFASVAFCSSFSLPGKARRAPILWGT